MATQKAKQTAASANKEVKESVKTTPAIVARIDRLVSGDTKTKAFASATIGEAFAIHGIRVSESDKGLFVAMPHESYTKDGEKKYVDTFHPITADARSELYGAVLEAYELSISEQMEKEQKAGAEMSM